ncbi:MAG: hypothetical protein M3Q30_04400 [Actinomycetota bacterium]|nr:hypothetical protein [Actinomycetota bacterium]
MQERNGVAPDLARGLTRRSGGSRDLATADRTGRVALGAFVAVETFALPFLITLGRSIWFTADEWDPIATRTAWDLGDLFRPHNEHWSTLPILVYRLLWWLVGLRTHLPYLVIAVLLHLTVAALLRAVMRRAGIGPWLATLAASAYLLFGAGYFNVEFAWQMAWGAALACGLGYLLLIDHDGPTDRRDVIGLLLGVAALMSAGPAVAMVIVVVIAAFLRRGWRVALLHAAPLGTIFLMWWVVIGRKSYVRHATLGEAARFMGRNLWATFRALGHLPGVGAALIVLLVSGLALIWVRPRDRSAWRLPTAPLALLVGAPVFLFITGTGRGALVFGVQPSNVSRYLDVAAVMMLPALALAAENVAKRWKALAPFAILALALGIPGNIRAFVDGTDGLVAQTRGSRSFILSVARNPIAKDLPRTLSPYAFSPDLTIGWLLDSVPSGRLPLPGPFTRDQLATETLSLALRPSFARPKPCRPLRHPAVRVLHKDDSLQAKSGRIDVVYLAPDSGQSAPRHLDSDALVALVGPLRLRLVPRAAPPDKVVALCG